MKRKTFGRSYGFCNTYTIVYCLGFLSIAIALAVGIEYLDAKKLSSSFAPGRSFSQHLGSYANLFLIGSTFVYIGHLYATAKAVGQVATGMATLGAMGVTVAFC